MNWQIWSVPRTMTSAALMTLGGMYPTMDCWDGGLQAGQVRCGSGTVCWGEVWLYLAVSDGVGGGPAYIHAESVTKHSPSKLFPLLVQSLETEVMGLQTHWVLAIGGQYLLSWSIFSNSTAVHISTYTRGAPGTVQNYHVFLSLKNVLVVK